MDDEESLKVTKANQRKLLREALAACEGKAAKGHGLFLYTHEDVDHMTILSFNAGPDDIYSLMTHAMHLIAHAIETAMQDAPPREKYN